MKNFISVGLLLSSVAAITASGDTSPTALKGKFDTSQWENKADCYVMIGQTFTEGFQSHAPVYNITVPMKDGVRNDGTYFAYSGTSDSILLLDGSVVKIQILLAGEKSMNWPDAAGDMQMRAQLYTHDSAGDLQLTNSAFAASDDIGGPNALKTMSKQLWTTLQMVPMEVAKWEVDHPYSLLENGVKSGALKDGVVNAVMVQCSLSKKDPAPAVK